jgi:hypothetical protein
VTDAEVARHYPCDDLVDHPTLEAWRGVTVHATPDLVWPWVTQVQAAPYSYDWIDNGGRRSPGRLLGLPDPQPGAHFTTVGGRRRLGRVLGVVPGEHLTATIMGAYLSYVLVPADGSTRLLLKVVAGGPRWAAPALSVGDLVMARRQLLNLKRLAEGTTDPRSD